VIHAGSYRLAMKNNRKKKDSTFGELIMGAYQAWGAGRAKRILRLASKAGLIVLQGHRHVLITGKTA
jgi:hypothetical protein